MTRQKLQITLAAIPLVILIIGPTFAYAENGVTPDPKKSATYNQGFSQGYIGLPLKGHHSQEFLTAYKNGTALYWSNRGDTEAYNGISPTSKNPDYLHGYSQGLSTRANIGPPSGNLTLPAHTDDNYLDYYIAVYNSALVADNDNSSNGPGDGTHSPCPSGHTHEYCEGWKAGYQYESYLLNDA